MTRDSAPEDDLWEVEPESFVRARDALVRALRDAGQAPAAERIKKLRKPTRDAWVVNLLARRDAVVIEALIDVGRRLREALATGDADALRELSRERGRSVAAAVQAAQRLVGTQLTPAVADAVRATLDAALADEGAADAVRAGRLSTGLVYAGLGLSGGIATPAPSRAAAASTATTAAPEEPSSPELSAVQPRRSTAKVTPLERPDSAKLRAAEQALRDAEDEVTAAQLARAEAQDHVDELAEQLEQAKAALAEAQAEARSANRARDAAAAVLERLRRRAT